VQPSAGHSYRFAIGQYECCFIKHVLERKIIMGLDDHMHVGKTYKSMPMLQTPCTYLIDTFAKGKMMHMETDDA
jgi:hypothetical protein